jgi:DNA mismatch repair protein MutS
VKQEVTPMMQHYLQTKEEYKDCILFYRLGDFYEMFFEDAKTVSKELELTLTGKSCGLEERAPMWFRFMPQTDISTGWSKKDTK